MSDFTVLYMAVLAFAALLGLWVGQQMKVEVDE